VGAISITGVASRRVTQTGAAIMIGIGFIGKIGALFASIPQAVGGAGAKVGWAVCMVHFATFLWRSCPLIVHILPVQMVAGVFTVMFSLIAGVSGRLRALSTTVAGVTRFQHSLSHQELLSHSACACQVGFSNLHGVNLQSHRNIFILGFGLCKWHDCCWSAELLGPCRCSRVALLVPIRFSHVMPHGILQTAACRCQPTLKATQLRMGTALWTPAAPHSTTSPTPSSPHLRRCAQRRACVVGAAMCRQMHSLHGFEDRLATASAMAATLLASHILQVSLMACLLLDLTIPTPAGERGKQAWQVQT